MVQFGSFTSIQKHALHTMWGQQFADEMSLGKRKLAFISFFFFSVCMKLDLAFYSLEQRPASLLILAVGKM